MGRGQLIRGWGGTRGGGCSTHEEESSQTRASGGSRGRQAGGRGRRVRAASNVDCLSRGCGQPPTPLQAHTCAKATPRTASRDPLGLGGPAELLTHLPARSLAPPDAPCRPTSDTLTEPTQPRQSAVSGRAPWQTVDMGLSDVAAAQTGFRPPLSCLQSGEEANRETGHTVVSLPLRRSTCPHACVTPTKGSHIPGSEDVTGGATCTRQRFAGTEHKPAVGGVGVFLGSRSA